jgi:hypothetical protein
MTKNAARRRKRKDHRIVAEKAMDKIGMNPAMKIGMIPVPNLPVGQTLDKDKADLKIAVQTDNVATNSNLGATTILILKRPKGTTLKRQGQMIQTIVVLETMVAETIVVETTQGVRTLILVHHSHLESRKIAQSPIIQMVHQL